MDDRSDVLPSSLDFLPEFVQAVQRSPLEASQIGSVALYLLWEAFAPQTLLLYQIDIRQPLLRLCARLPAHVPSPETLSLDVSAADGPSLLARISQNRKPVFLADLHNPTENELVPLASAFIDEQTRGFLCLPLWSGESLEGVLVACFTTPLSPSSWKSYALVSCGLHLATALAHARPHLTVADSRLRFYNILDQVPEGMLMIEATTGVVRYANPVASQILGRPLHKLVGALLHPYADTTPDPSNHQHPLFFWTFAVARALSGKTLQQVETVVVRPDGTRVPVLCSSAPVRATQGMQAGAILLLQDISVQKRLEHDDNLFLSMASHELRTPLTTIVGYADVLKHEIESADHKPLDPAIVGSATDHILSQSEQMTFVINEMLDLSALDRDQFILHRAPQNLVALLTSVIETQTVTTNNHQLHLVVDEQVKSQGCPIQGDAHRLTQALTNLVANAVKYTPRGGDIEIGIRLEEQPSAQVVLWVKDQGVGIAHEELAHVFDRFYRSPKLHGSLSGFGLGLYLAKQVIVRHGGRIWAESVEGGGSTFFVVLPREPEQGISH